jgi:hypothetical protein
MADVGCKSGTLAGWFSFVGTDARHAIARRASNGNKMNNLVKRGFVF